MTSTRTLSRSFAAGEISPEMAGRIDLGPYQTGLALCRNFIPLPQGSVQNRPGTEHVREVKTSAKRTRVIPFSFSPTQTMILEFGDQYIRFHTMGATLLLLGVPYEVVTPYLEADLFDLHYVQSADVLTIVHPNYAPRELRRLGATNWTLTVIDFETTQDGAGGFIDAVPFDPNFPDPLEAPAFFNMTAFSVGVDNVAYKVAAIGSDPRAGGYNTTTMTAVGVDKNANIGMEWGSVGSATGYRVFRSDDGTITGNFEMIAETTGLTLTDNRIAADPFTLPVIGSTPGATTETYVLTLVGADGQESYQSSPDDVFNDLTLINTANVISVDIGISPTIEYVSFNVYKLKNGMYGFIGSAPVGGNVADNNIEPDLSRQPPAQYTPFDGTGNFPGAASYFEQRRLFAGTTNLPQTVWGTRTGTESNLSANVLVQDSDGFSFRIASREVNSIRHLVPLTDVLILTNSAEWRLTSTDGGGLAPGNLSVRPQSYIGANNVQPVVTSSSMLYAQARGGHMREIVYNLGEAGISYSNVDMSLLATHLFDYKTIVDLAYSKAPQQVLWAVSSDGKLLSLSYVPEQKVAGWASHTTGAAGLFESCAVVAENNEDSLYVVVQRTINGSQKRFVERLHTRSFVEVEDAFFVDCGLTYTGAAATVISGLGHLEGQTVAVLGNGAVFPPKVVAAGQITLEEAVTKAHIGLAIDAEIRTLPLTTEQLAAFGAGRTKNVNKVFLRLFRSSIIKAGPSTSTLRELKQRTTEPYGSPPSLVGEDESVEVEIVVTPTWSQGGQIFVVATDPLPATIQALVLDVAIGG